MKKITDILEKGFTYSVEMVPPRNCHDIQKLFDKLEVLKDVGVDFISVTKGAGGSLRGGTLPLAYYAHAKYDIPSIAHFTCREINRYEVENGLVDQHYFGIRNILALRGDPPVHAHGNDWTGEYKHAYQLVEQIVQTNCGRYLARPGVDDNAHRDGFKTDYCIGVAAHPEESSGKRVEYLQKKVDSGAHFAITQMIFDVELYANFMDDVRAAGITIPIVPGVFPITTHKKAKMIEKEFGVTLPDEFKALLAIEDPKEFREKSIAWTINFCKQLREAGAPGVHLFVYQNVKLAKEIIEQLR